jgi:hypothetical protein
MGGHHRQSFSAKTATVLVDFWLKYWQWAIGVVIAVAGIILHFLK